MFIVDNDGPRIVSTNYWESEQSRAGKLYVSLNAGAFRVLVPPSQEALVAEMSTALGCCVSRGPWPAMRLGDAFEILFDDGSSDPFALHLSPESFDRLPSPLDTVREVVCSVWTRGADGNPKLALERPARYRLSKRLPDLRPWDVP